MEILTPTLVVSVFAAGFLTFLAPCTLPLVPAFIALISGNGTTNSRTQTSRARSNSIAFVLGFSIVFILFGTLLGLLGTHLGPVRTLLSQFGGVLIVFFGLMVLGIFDVPFLRMRGGFPVPHFMVPGNFLSSLLIGALFALGWTPCIGPLLSSVLLLVSAFATVFQGIILLSVFSLGLGLPFILTGICMEKATAYIGRLTGFANVVRIIGALFLIVIGVVLLTNNFGFLLQYGYTVFNALHLDALFDYF